MTKKHTKEEDKTSLKLKIIDKRLSLYPHHNCRILYTGNTLVLYNPLFIDARGAVSLQRYKRQIIMVPVWTFWLAQQTVGD